MSRIIGWTAHVMEQAGSNALIHPPSASVGPSQRSLTAFDR
ncbi:2-methylcitrate synthase [Mycobacterium attenuatum]|nr:2-methylcitrate synthase [Mycobacterium attenuatum]